MIISCFLLQCFLQEIRDAQPRFHIVVLIYAFILQYFKCSVVFLSSIVCISAVEYLQGIVVIFCVKEPLKSDINVKIL